MGPAQNLEPQSLDDNGSVVSFFGHNDKATFGIIAGSNDATKLIISQASVLSCNWRRLAGLKK